MSLMTDIIMMMGRSLVPSSSFIVSGYSENGNHNTVYLSGKVYISGNLTHNLAAMDTETYAVTRYAQGANAYPAGLATDGTSIYIALLGTGSVGAVGYVRKVSSAGATLWTTVNIGSGVHQLIHFNDFIYATNLVQNKVHKIDASNGTVVTSTALSSYGTAPYAICTDGTYVYVSMTGSAKIVKLTLALVYGAQIAIGTAPYGVAHDGTNLWATGNSGSTSNLYRIDTTTNAILNTYALGTNLFPAFLTYYPELGLLGTACVDTDQFKLMSPASGAVLATYATGDSPSNGSLDSNRHFWVANYTSDNLTKII